MSEKGGGVKLGRYGSVSALVRILGALGFLALAACGGVDHLDAAMRAFDRAAVAEQQVRAAGATLSDGADPASAALKAASPAIAARAGYANVIRHIGEMKASDRKALADAGAWGLVLALRAQARWKLGQFTEAEADAAKAVSDYADQLGARDAFVLRALPGLVRNDQAYRLIYVTPREGVSDDQRLTEVTGLLRRAMETFRSVRAGAPDTALALRLAALRWELAAYKNYLAAYHHIAGKSPPPGEADCNAYRAVARLDGLVAGLDGLPDQGFGGDDVLAPEGLTREDGAEEVDAWQVLLGFAEISPAAEATYCGG